MSFLSLARFIPQKTPQVRYAAAPPENTVKHQAGHARSCPARAAVGETNDYY